jgi:hypothetical protein
MPATRLAVALALLVTACAPRQVAEEVRPDPELVAVAQSVCPVLWNWQLDVGGIMNSMSASTRFEPDLETRKERYRTALSSARDRNVQLAAAIEEFSPGPYVDVLREDIRNGLFHANRIIADLDEEVALLDDDSTARYHAAVPRIFMALEKVIDVAKPEMSRYADAELTRAFISVPQCQHGVKDANDGIPRYVPRT